MPRPEPNRIVAGLPDAIPFVAPEEYERQIGTTFLARLGANESVWGPSGRAIEAMTKAVINPQWYGDPLSFELRTELGFRFGLSPDHFVVGPGIDGLFSHIASSFLTPGDRVVTTLGSYPTFNYFIDAVGSALVQVPYEDFQVNLSGLAQAVHKNQAQMVYVANPDNPSGSLQSKSGLQQFLKMLPDNVLVILDEAYLEFVEEYDLFDPRLIRLRTFSKLYGMAGARIGYAIGEPETLQPLNRIRPHFEVNSIAQAGALASLRDKDFPYQIRQKNEASKLALRSILEARNLPTIASSTNFILADAGSKDRAEMIVAKLRGKGIFIRKPGLPPLDHFIRITAGTDQDHEFLADALNEVLR